MRTHGTDRVERGEHPDISTTEGTASASSDGGCAPAPCATPGITLFVCTTCRTPDAPADAPRAGAALVEATRAAATGDMAVKGVACLANCKRALSAALVRRDGWTYLFGDLGTEAAPDLIEGARLLAGSADGLMPWRGRPEALKRGMVARIPPFTFEEP
ncbi:DUF1636 family protein [Xanthobacter autotrophicus DSM 431]|uniref:DUF1636 family protein n=1 Tax=Xanthobacter nonsaccharivorans TaxID=3119912 RepID=UPI00372CBD0D